MKKINKLVLSAVAALVLMYSCKDSFLDQPVTGQLDKNILAGRLGLDGSLLAVYSQVNGRSLRMASPSNWLWGSIRGGDANKGTDPGDYSTINPVMRYAALATGDVIEDKWKGNYEGVARANSTLRLLQTADPSVTKDYKISIKAQTMFLRAHFYFELTRGYGKTLWVDETVDYGTGIDTARNVSTNLAHVLSDMKFAYDSLPETQDEVGRVNKWAAAAYLGKIYMWMKQPDKALPYFNECITKGQTSNGKKYALVASFPDLFKATNDNNEESIWAYQSAANTGSVNNANPEFDLNWPYNTGTDGPGNCCSFFQPTFESGNWFRTTPGGLPYIDGTYNDHEVVTDMNKESGDPFTPDAGPLDPRIDHTIGRRGIPYLDWEDFPGKAWIRNQPNAGPYETKKFVYYRGDKGSLQDNSSWTPGYTAINFPIIRFGDILLMTAECEIAVNHDTEKARTYVNMIRTRAKNSFLKRADGTNAANYVISTYDAPFASEAEATRAVRFERQLELHSEGHRFYDLVRWGVASDVLNKFIAYEAPKYGLGALTGATFDAGVDELLPYPQSQIDLLGSDKVKQNAGY